MCSTELAVDTDGTIVPIRFCSTVNCGPNTRSPHLRCCQKRQLADLKQLSLSCQEPEIGRIAFFRFPNATDSGENPWQTAA